MKYVNEDVQIFRHAEKIIVGILAHSLWDEKYLKSIPNTSITACDKIISVLDTVSTKTTNTIAANIPINSNGKKVGYKIDCYVLQFH